MGSLIGTFLWLMVMLGASTEISLTTLRQSCEPAATADRMLWRLRDDDGRLSRTRPHFYEVSSPEQLALAVDALEAVDGPDLSGIDRLSMVELATGDFQLFVGIGGQLCGFDLNGKIPHEMGLAIMQAIEADRVEKIRFSEDRYPYAQMLDRIYLLAVDRGREDSEFSRTCRIVDGNSLRRSVGTITELGNSPTRLVLERNAYRLGPMLYQLIGPYRYRDLDYLWALVFEPVEEGYELRVVTRGAECGLNGEITLPVGLVHSWYLASWPPENSDALPEEFGSMRELDAALNQRGVARLFGIDGASAPSQLD